MAPARITSEAQQSTQGNVDPTPSPDRGSEARVENDAPTAVLVMGMHRSGTSAITRVISLLGADLPSNIMPAHPLVNRTGFWEPQDIVSIHDEAMFSAGSSWNDVGLFPESWFNRGAANSFLERLVSKLEDNFSGSSMFVIKDPRLCRLAPLWAKVLRAIHANPAVVFLYRNPLEVAASMMIAHGMPPLEAMLLWLRYVLEGERHTRSWSRVFVDFSDLLRDWRTTMERVRQELEVEWPRKPDHAEAQIDEFLSKTLRHHRYSGDDLDQRWDIPDQVRIAFAALKASSVNSEEELTETFDSISRQIDATGKVFEPIIADARSCNTTPGTGGYEERQESAVGAPQGVSNVRPMQGPAADEGYDEETLQAIDDEHPPTGDADGGSSQPETEASPDRPAAVEPDPGQLATASTTNLLQAQIEDLRAVLSATKSLLTALEDTDPEAEDELAQRDREIRRLNDALRARDVEIQIRDRELISLEAKVETLAEQLAQQRKGLGEIYTVLLGGKNDKSQE